MHVCVRLFEYHIKCFVDHNICLFFVKLDRVPIHGSFSISGATGKNSAQVNGTFEPTDEVQNGLPVYKKKGSDGSLWVEAVKGASGWRWYLKTTANKGLESSVCFAYVNFSLYNAGLPQDVKSGWFVYCEEGYLGFLAQSLSVEPVGSESTSLKQKIDAFKSSQKVEV